MSRRRCKPSGLVDSVFNSGIYGWGNSGEGRVLVYKLAKDNESLIRRMRRYKTCKVHSGCVNSICWNDSGDRILSGSDDQRIKITEPFGVGPKVLLDYKTPHRSNIFCARFLPLSCDSRVVSCSGDGLIHYTHVDRSPEENAGRKFNCHDGTCYKIITVPNEAHSFMSCGEDHTLRYFDLRVKESCSCVEGATDVVICATRAITSMCINPLVPWYLAVGTADSSVSIFDRRRLSVGGKEKGVDALKSACVSCLTVPELESSERFYRITSLNYSTCGKQILASYSSDYLYLFDTQDKSESKLFSCDSTDREMSGSDGEEVPSKKVKKNSKPQLRRLRLRGDWSDTGPNARPQNQAGGEIGQARPTLQQSLMERMTFVLSQMLNDISSISGDQQAGASNRTNGHVNPPSEEEQVQGASGGSGSGPAARESGGGGGERSLSTSSEQLEDQLGYLRSSFVSRHNVEPGAVSLSYREGGSNAGLISVSVGSESEREGGRGVVDEIRAASTSKNVDEDSFSDKPLKGGRVLMKYTGHRNARTMIKEANFYGDEYVLSGSDCGHVFIWEKRSGNIVQILEADNHVVNNVQPHPYDPVIATSGIDYDIKLFAPVSDVDTFDYVEARELMKRNEIMLEETKDTITVPAAFMIRMLSCLSHIRRLGAGSGGGAQEPASESDDASSQSLSREGEGGERGEDE